MKFRNLLRTISIANKGLLNGWVIGTLLQFADVKEGVIKKAFDGIWLQYVLSPLQIGGAVLGAIGCSLLYHSLKKQHDTDVAYDISLGYIWSVGACGLVGGVLGAKLHSTVLAYLGVIVGSLIGYRLNSLNHRRRSSKSTAH